MKFKGSIIITDPCYICKDEDWGNIAFEDDLMGIGFKNAIKGDTIYGDWSCTTFSSRKSDPKEMRSKYLNGTCETPFRYGEFCAMRDKFVLYM